MRVKGGEGQVLVLGVGGLDGHCKKKLVDLQLSSYEHYTLSCKISDPLHASLTETAAPEGRRKLVWGTMALPWDPNKKRERGLGVVSMTH